MERLAEENNREASDEFREMVEEEGCDGVYYNADLNEEWVAFEPTQIKRPQITLVRLTEATPTYGISLSERIVREAMLKRIFRVLRRNSPVTAEAHTPMIR